MRPKLSWSPGRTDSGGPSIGQHSDEARTGDSPAQAIFFAFAYCN